MGVYEHANEPVNCKPGGKVLDYLKDDYFLKKDSDPRDFVR
jgi:hypothetical protein